MNAFEATLLAYYTLRLWRGFDGAPEMSLLEWLLIFFSST